jgi:hypothetical protein
MDTTTAHPLQTIFCSFFFSNQALVFFHFPTKPWYVTFLNYQLVSSQLMLEKVAIEARLHPPSATVSLAPQFAMRPTTSAHKTLSCGSLKEKSTS